MQSNLLTCGIDVHYKKSYLCLKDEKGEILDLEELETNHQTISRFLEKYQNYSIQYAFEACTMSHYMYDFLKEQPNTKKIHVVHPYKFKVISASKHKNDKNDCIRLSEALLKDYLPYPVYIKSPQGRNLQVLLNIRRRKVQNQTKIILQAKSFMRSHGISIATQSLKSKHGFENLLSEFKNNDAASEIVQILADDFLNAKESIKAIEDKMLSLIDSHYKNEYKLLCSIPGIGFVTAASLCATIDNIARFNKAGELSAYLGVVPSENSSGDVIKHGKITKEGKKEIRSLLIQSAWTLIRMKNSNDKRLYNLKGKFYRISLKGKNSQKAIIAIARHLTRIIFGVLISQNMYSGEM